MSRGASFESLPPILLTIALTVAGQLLIKRGVADLQGSGLAMLSGALREPAVLGGLACATLAAGCWIVSLARAPLSFAYPFMALAIVLVLVLSSALFGETVSLRRWAGVAIVCLGLVVASMRD